MIRSRLAALLGALALPLLLAGCSLGRLHILIPDFAASGVDGIRLFRVVDGELVAAGRVLFGDIVRTATGLQMEYTQIIPGRDSWGPVTTAVKEPATGQLELQLALYNSWEAGNFRFASFNEKGMSPVTAGQLFLPRSY